MYVCFSIHLSLCLLICLPASLSAYLHVCSSVWLSVCLSADLSVRLSICSPSVRQSICFVCLQAVYMYMAVYRLNVRLSSIYVFASEYACLYVYLRVCMSLWPSMWLLHTRTAKAIASTVFLTRSTWCGKSANISTCKPFRQTDNPNMTNG